MLLGVYQISSTYLLYYHSIGILLSLWWSQCAFFWPCLTGAVTPTTSITICKTSSLVSQKQSDRAITNSGLQVKVHRFSPLSAGLLAMYLLI